MDIRTPNNLTCICYKVRSVAPYSLLFILLGQIWLLTKGPSAVMDDLKPNDLLTKNDLSNLRDIRNDLANLRGIRDDLANLRGIRVDLAKLRGIRVDLANLGDDLRKGIMDDMAKLGEDLRKCTRYVDMDGTIQSIVEKEIAKHAADGLGMADYALATAGAVIVKHSATMWAVNTQVVNKPDNMLRPSFGEPCQCFYLNGTSGFVLIQLTRPIVPQAITLEHVAKGVAYDRSSAPRHCRVLGWLETEEVFEKECDREDMHLLTEFTYDLDKSNNVQTFEVFESVKSLTVSIVRFEFTSNHGQSGFTSIYRLRVHGQLSLPPYTQMVNSDL